MLISSLRGQHHYHNSRISSYPDYRSCLTINSLVEGTCTDLHSSSPPDVAKYIRTANNVCTPGNTDELQHPDHEAMVCALA